MTEKTLGDFIDVVVQYAASKGLHIAMPPFETIARPRRNRISVSVPREYSSYSFQVILVPLGVDMVDAMPSKPRKSGSFVDALLSCPKLDDGETLDVSRDSYDNQVGALVADDDSRHICG